MCCSQQYYLVIRVNVARELNSGVFSPMVLILIRNTNAFIQRIAFAPIFKRAQYPAMSNLFVEAMTMDGLEYPMAWRKSPDNTNSDIG